MQTIESLEKETSSRTPEEFWRGHKILSQYNQGRLIPRFPSGNWQRELELEARMHKFEMQILEEERTRILRMANEAPKSPDEFMIWYEELRNVGPGQNDPLFPWLAQSATVDQMTWFIKQEVAGEAGFEDLTALTQLKMPTKPKLEIARNYWDEMGRGQENGMHGPMLSRLAKEMKISSAPDEIVPEALALGNILLGLATNRHYAFHSIGALGIIELTAPDRAYQVYLGLRRLGISGEGQRYFLLHSTLDKKHSAAWNKEVIRPLIENSPQIAAAIAEGALMRLQAGARCFERYRQSLWTN